MRALYDCGRYITSFNFFEWLVQAQARGATKVIFDIRNMRGNKWPISLSMQRFRSILEPGPALARLPYQTFDNTMLGATQAFDIAQPGGKPLVDFWKAGGRFDRLRSVHLPDCTHRYTVTLRKTQRSPLRDSDEPVWREFAKEIGALVIEDYDVKPISLHRRVALYAGADMNFFVSNGPGILCSFTTYPCMLFNTVHAAGSLKEDGIEYGAQYPWMLSNQRTIWEIATAESLRRHFYHWKEKGEFADDRVPAPA